MKNSKPKVLVTGATGFVGRSLILKLLSQDHIIHAAVRREYSYLPAGVEKLFFAELTSATDWAEELKAIDVIVHLAARVHIMNDCAVDPLDAFRKINVKGTLNLARQAAETGVKRFIFLSSIKVNGEQTAQNSCFSEEDSFIPMDPYGLSKYEAEQGLLQIARKTDMEVVIIRSPLVYGPGVKANFLLMMTWLDKGIPLPFGAIHNQRSLIALENLTDFLALCIDHPKAANEIFLIADDEDVSTTLLLRKVAQAFGKKSVLVPVPVRLMKFLAAILNKREITNRLFASLRVDSSKARKLLGWKPVITMDDQLKITVAAYLNQKTSS